MVTHQDVFCGWVPVLWLGSCLMVGFLSYGSVPFTSSLPPAASSGQTVAPG